VARAQYNTKSEWSVGLTGGGTLSNITLVPKLVDKKFVMGRNGGISVRYISEPHFGLQAEINLLETGWAEDEEGKGLTTSYQRNLQLVDVPFLLHAYTDDRVFRGILNVGPRFSYLLSESETLVEGFTTLLHHGKTVENPFQYGIVGGGGFELHLKRLVIGLEGRYTYYLSNLFADAVSDDFNTSALQVVSINAYLQVKL
jgi:hypothetical protein